MCPDKVAPDKIAQLRAYGAEVVVCPTSVEPEHPDSYYSVSDRLSKERAGAWKPDQYHNQHNPQAQYDTTGPEIWEQMGGDIDAFVAGVGSGGTISGAGRYLKSKNPSLRVVVADPVGSVVAEAAETGEIAYAGGSWLVEGIGEDFIPPNLDLSVVDEGVTVSDRDAFDAARALLAVEGIIGGSSTGTLVAGALDWCRRQTTPKRVVTFVCDTGNKYLSKVYDLSLIHI